MPSGSYPTVDSGHGWVSIVCTTLSLVVSMTETVSLFVLATNSALPSAYSAVGCRPTVMVADGRGRVRGVDDADRAGGECPGSRWRAPGCRRSSWWCRRAWPGGRPRCSRRACRPRRRARAGRCRRSRSARWSRCRVERHDGVLPVERGVHGGPVGREHGLADQRGVGRRSPAVTRKVAAHRRERETGRRAEGAVGVDRELGLGVLLGKPEVLAVRRVRRAFLADGAVGQGLVDPGAVPTVQMSL